MASEKYNKPLSAEDIRRVRKTGMALMTGSIVFMAVWAFLIHKEFPFARLHPSNIKPDTLKGFAFRVEYALRYQSLLVFWLVFNVFAVIFARFKSKALNPLDERTEQKVLIFKYILNNSFESIIISIFSQLIFVSFGDPVVIYRFIPFINVIMFIGRVAFFAGYPLKRAFGFGCTLLPNTVLTVYNLYKFGSFIGLYA